MEERQKLLIDLRNIEIEIPETHIIILKQQLVDLKRNSQIGQYLTHNDVLKMLSVSRPWFLNNVLYNPKIRSKIDINQNIDGFVKYPQTRGGRYYFLASKTKEYFEKHFRDIFDEI
ncbi:DUF771 domain-containing protein [Streptococcus dysgalactiae subsp. equisimilis]